MIATQAVENMLAQGWSATGASEANKAGVVTKAAASGKTHYITGFSVAVSAAAAGATAGGFAVELKNGNTTIWKEIFAASAAVGSRIGVTFPAPIACTNGGAVSINCAALGTGSISVLNLNGFTI
jgi:hypothetical protein